MSCLRSQRSSPNHHALPLCAQHVYQLWHWSGCGASVVQVSQAAHSPYPSSYSGVFSGLEKNKHPQPSYLRPWHREMPGSDVRPWKGWGEERVPFSTRICTQLPASEETLDSNWPSFSFPFSGLTGGVVSHGPCWPQPDCLAKCRRSDALDCPALCSR